MTRAFPAFALVALAGLVAGAVTGARTQSSAERVATQFVEAWRAGDHAAMHRLLTPAARAQTTLAAFRAAYAEAATTATATGLAPAGDARDEGDEVIVPLAVRTEVFGTVDAELRLPTESRPASWLEERVAWEPHLTFPDVLPGASLERRSEAPARADIVAADGTVLASGDGGSRESEEGERIAGRVGPAEERSRRDELYERGFSRKAPVVGRSGLEEALDPLLAGTPGGQLLAGENVLASSEPRATAPVRTTVDPDLQADAVEALGGRAGGAAALDAETAEVRALAGTAVSAPEPPGSTFKIVTATAALDADVADPSSTFPVRTLESVEKVELDAIQGEACGGTFASGFAKSCNAMFAALGLEIGADRLVSTAERYGFNEAPAIPGAAESTLPAAEAIAPSGSSAKRERVALAETAIGQGEVRTTALQSASMAQTIAADGSRTQPTLIADAPPAAPVRVTSAATASTIGELMMAVVSEGTAAGAGLPAGEVAGKTGTAQLDRKTQNALLSDADTDAWFTAYAPAAEPRLAVAVHLRGSGSGGRSAAPAAAPLIEAALAPGD